MMNLTLSPLDGRYKNRIHSVAQYFSEEKILKSKYDFEIDYLEFLNKILSLNKENSSFFKKIKNDFVLSSIVYLEKNKTKHDIKAIEFYIQETIPILYPEEQSLIPFVHFGLTSQDINSLATSYAISQWHKEYALQILDSVIFSIDSLSARCDLTFPARTHGQYAVQTNLKKELSIFSARLLEQREKLRTFIFRVKFGGAVGNLSAHYLAYPDIDWKKELSDFLFQKYGLIRQELTTQVDNNDWLAEYFSIWSRINNILVDFCRDIWMYFSYGYFKKRVSDDEIGSSAMPQKINPIEFENGEGNLEFANSVFNFMGGKLQVSRMQRDLTDTTVVRNLGLPFGHSVVAYYSIVDGCNKISPNEEEIFKDLSSHPEMLAEGIQTLLRVSGEESFNLVKAFFRGTSKSYFEIKKFILDLALPAELEMRALNLIEFYMDKKDGKENS